MDHSSGPGFSFGPNCIYWLSRPLLALDHVWCILPSVTELPFPLSPVVPYQDPFSWEKGDFPSRPVVQPLVFLPSRSDPSRDLLVCKMEALVVAPYPFGYVPLLLGCCRPQQ